MTNRAKLVDFVKGIGLTHRAITLEYVIVCSLFHDSMQARWSVSVVVLAPSTLGARRSCMELRLTETEMKAINNLLSYA